MFFPGRSEPGRKLRSAVYADLNRNMDRYNINVYIYTYTSVHLSMSVYTYICISV